MGRAKIGMTVQIGDRWRIVSDRYCYSLEEFGEGSTKGVKNGVFKWRDANCYYGSLESMLKEVSEKHLKVSETRTLKEFREVAESFKQSMIHAIAQLKENGVRYDIK